MLISILGSSVIVLYGFNDQGLGHDCNSKYSASCDTVFTARSTAFTTMTWDFLLFAWQLDVVLSCKLEGKGWRKAAFQMEVVLAFGQLSQKVVNWSLAHVDGRFVLWICRLAYKHLSSWSFLYVLGNEVLSSPLFPVLSASFRMPPMCAGARTLVEEIINGIGYASNTDVYYRLLDGTWLGKRRGTKDLR